MIKKNYYNNNNTCNNNNNNNNNENYNNNNKKQNTIKIALLTFSYSYLMATFVKTFIWLLLMNILLLYLIRRP